MTTIDSTATAVAGALCEGLKTARRDGARSVAAHHLPPEQFEALTSATLVHLRSVPGKASDIEGWTIVTARGAAVITWWGQSAGLTEGELRRLSALRREVYDSLIEQGLITKGPGRSTSVHVSPVAKTLDTGVAEDSPTYATVNDAAVHDATVHDATVHEAPTADADGPGAWTLKLSPFLYDANRVFAAPDQHVRIWSVEDHERSALMQYGDRVYLWVSDGDPYRTSGVWGVGYVAGPTVLGIADDGWLDYEAASQARVFAVVDIVLLDGPVTRQAFLDDPRLAGAEVISDPYAPNPGVLTGSEAEALAEHLSAGASEPRVA